jgi:hypothetical protein
MKTTMLATEIRKARRTNTLLRILVFLKPPKKNA